MRTYSIWHRELYLAFCGDTSMGMKSKKDIYIRYICLIHFIVYQNITQLVKQLYPPPPIEKEKKKKRLQAHSSGSRHNVPSKGPL